MIENLCVNKSLISDNVEINKEAKEKIDKKPKVPEEKNVVKPNNSSQISFNEFSG